MRKRQEAFPLSFCPWASGNLSGLWLQSSVWTVMGSGCNNEAASRLQVREKQEEGSPWEEEASLIPDSSVPHFPSSSPWASAGLSIPVLCPEPSHTPPVALSSADTLRQHPLLQHSPAPLPPPMLGQGTWFPTAVPVLKNELVLTANKQGLVNAQPLCDLLRVQRALSFVFYPIGKMHAVCSATEFPQGFAPGLQTKRKWGLADPVNEQQEQAKSSSQITQLTQGRAATRISPTARGSLPEACLQAQRAGCCPLCPPRV